MRSLRAKTSFYNEKQRLLVSPRKMFMCPYDKSAIIIEFHLKPQIEVVFRADVSGNRLPETIINFSDYDISQPSPSVSLSVPSCSLGGCDSMGESLFTFFASLAYVPLFLLELQNRLFWILKELYKISFVWKYGADMLNSFLVMRA